ncbi:tyrosine-type recombinase/integrase [Salmonella enterica]|uniref:tyrosine-type recombinase/integrase n=1 Tax=Salmonella TaxID=590 RepID=UPI0002BA1CA2|nr:MULTISPECIES: integrase arm-type DNA-binding domain-containing protein [Salmonella]EBU0430704.1 tyrosine-type recombinase/integrase [Salmonella enterica]ECM8012486.1 tyrosine-type recombinase/integrase [Salmonella enterica subsp. enterica serovar Newport]ECV9049920.1 tyrosine-type recombinase/integrase [Salmonella enterica subsp. enterica serovar Newport]EGP3502184.1 tyrosine-type recombinase/integrase [Salmonella enterica subsp. enterica serovar Newport]EKY5349843.1 tyrosine-type recombina
MSLNARQVETCKPKEKEYKLFDERGLYLLVKPNGSRYWRMKFHFGGKERKLSIGVYPDISLAEARNRRDEARRLLAEGIDPTEKKKLEKLTRKISVENTFRALALEWHKHKATVWAKTTANWILDALEKDIFPTVGKRPVTEILPLEMLTVFRCIEKRGALVKMGKLRRYCSQIFRYAIATGRATSNPVANLACTLATPHSSHFPHLSADELPEFIHKLRSYDGPVTRAATQLLFLTGLRTIELRAAEWGEIDFDNALWTIPQSRMKKRRTHLVPLSRQVVAILRELQALTGRFRLLFPGRNNVNKPISEATVNKVLKILGYRGKATGHGFRHTISTILHEQGFNSAWIEMQLAHVDKNAIRGTYNHALYLENRREMMQWYADYIDSLADLKSNS